MDHWVEPITTGRRRVDQLTAMLEWQHQRDSALPNHARPDIRANDSASQIAESNEAASESQTPSDEYVRSSDTAEALLPQPPGINTTMTLRARMLSVSDIEMNAREGSMLLDKAVVSAHELRKILNELAQLISPAFGQSPAPGPWVSELEQIRIEVERLLGALKYQQNGSIDGSTLGDALRADIDSARAA